MNKLMTPPAWICPSCQRSRRTNFCPDCGDVRPTPEVLPAQIEKLRAMLLAERSAQVAAFNTAHTWGSRSVAETRDSAMSSTAYEGWTNQQVLQLMESNVESWQKKGNQSKSRADAIEWAILQIEKES